MWKIVFLLVVQFLFLQNVVFSADSLIETSSLNNWKNKYEGLQNKIESQIIGKLKQRNSHLLNEIVEPIIKHFQQQKSTEQSKSAVATNNVRVKSSSNANSNFGYVYQQFYYSNQCNGTIFAAIGISTTACLPLKNSSFSLSFSQEDCADLTVNTFNDMNCQEFIGSENIYQNISQCFQETVYQSKSSKLFCSPGTSIPVNQDSVVFSLYLNQSSECQSQSKEYVSFSTNICASDLGFLNFTIPVKSITASCTSTGFTVYGYPDSTTCDGFNVHETFSNACHDIKGTKPNVYLGNFSVMGSCYEFKTPIPTVSPTHRPSNRPTFKPTANYVLFTAGQSINGINYTTYISNISAYSLTLKTSIASCMTGLTASNIINLNVYPGSTTGRRLFTLPASLRSPFNVKFDVLATSSNSIYTNYTVSTTQSGVTYDSLSTQLSDNIANGVFDSYLKQYSSVYGAPGFANASSTAVTTTNSLAVSNGSSGSNGLSRSAVAGIVVGGIGFGLLVIFLGYHLFFRRRTPTKRQESNMSVESNISNKKFSEMSNQSNFTQDSTNGQDPSTVTNIMHGEAGASLPRDNNYLKPGTIQEAIPVEK